MSTEHILFAGAQVFPKPAPELSPQGAIYDRRLGAWVLTSDPTRLLVLDPGRRPPGTKKNDIETGEDQKGA